MKSINILLLVLLVFTNVIAQDLTTEHDNIASIIVKSLDPQSGEKVVIRYDPEIFTGLEHQVKYEETGWILEEEGKYTSVGAMLRGMPTVVMLNTIKPMII